jgi:hypothetical protein
MLRLILAAHQIHLIVSPNLDRSIAPVNRLDLPLGQLELESTEELIEPLVASDTDDRGGDPRRGEGPSEGDFGHRDVTLLGNLLDLVNDLFLRGLRRSASLHHRRQAMPLTCSPAPFFGREAPRGVESISLSGRHSTSLSTPIRFSDHRKTHNPHQEAPKG